jgi:hypothetical protein
MSGYRKIQAESDELYHRAHDPHETTNLAGLPDHATVVTALRERILDWLVDTSDVIPYIRDPRMEPGLVETFLPSPTHWPSVPRVGVRR